MSLIPPVAPDISSESVSLPVLPGLADRVDLAGLVDLAAAAAHLREDGALIFPTETFYGLGCLASSAKGAALVYQLKGRSVQKPLPSLAADLEQAGALLRLHAAPPGLLEHFWPGPLTVLLPPREKALAAPLVPCLFNERGLAAVRVTSHPLAAALAREAGGLITASSANPSGGAAAQSLAALAPALRADLAKAHGLMLAGGPQPAGGQPSTLVEPLADGRLRVLREGAVPCAALLEAGFILC